MQIRNYYPGSWGSNCYLLTSDNLAAVIDPSADTRTLKKVLDEENLQLQYILLTHGHFDHIASMDGLRAATGAPVMIHASEADFLSDSRKNAFYSFFCMDHAYGSADKTFVGGDILPFGKEEIRVLHTPGHTRGSVCFFCGDFLVTGDTIFAKGYGRTDLYSGNSQDLRQSFRSLFALPGYLPIYPGHGEPSTLSAALSYIGYLD